jgi:uncharacterized peroxidase-related enzyme
VAADHRHADLTPRERAMVDLAVKLTKEPAAVGHDDVRRMREAGFSDGDIWDIGAIAAFFNLSNRMASLTDLRPNAEFYAMGRG